MPTNETLSGKDRFIRVALVCNALTPISTVISATNTDTIAQDLTSINQETLPTFERAEFTGATPSFTLGTSYVTDGNNGTNAGGGVVFNTSASEKTITITNGYNYFNKKMTLYFDTTTSKKGYCPYLEVKYYDGATLLYTDAHTPTSNRYVFTTRSNSPLGYTTIKITLYAWSVPNAKMEVSRIYPYEHFEVNEQIISVQSDEQFDIYNLSFPINTYDIILNNNVVNYPIDKNMYINMWVKVFNTNTGQLDTTILYEKLIVVSAINSNDGNQKTIKATDVFDINNGYKLKSNVTNTSFTFDTFLQKVKDYATSVGAPFTFTPYENVSGKSYYYSEGTQGFNEYLNVLLNLMPYYASVPNSYAVKQYVQTNVGYSYKYNFVSYLTYLQANLQTTMSEKSIYSYRLFEQAQVEKRQEYKTIEVSQYDTSSLWTTTAKTEVRNLTTTNGTKTLKIDHKFIDNATSSTDYTLYFAVNLQQMIQMYDTFISFDWAGNPLIKCGDIVETFNLSSKLNSYFKCVVTRKQMYYDGGWSEKIELATSSFWAGG